ncbi:glycerophosphodiester phosphodiesterase [Novosphingobium album (ex Liu et al. 2023)]|uniref:Glycerophosphodiester phosphodiesterase family protein n=1 Tax=Novosphingobium album (ex Liu et al. 2023) TaxID=3031130 RepID=A0ABT5WME1_9SPHN|nr:glycerophosphodiester phosphodiesterase family protein [Novosphingobium album (ex Liu et al. 2023)]MDE8651217.1 glycerophosphodiester phosphodiesterase family protein [Novosphingobium album (ex Liu et al. 2023)]
MRKITQSRACRRHLTAGLAAAAALLAAGHGFARDDAGAGQAAPAAPPIMVIAHRGGAMVRPENTMPAFRHAADLHAEYLEFDMEMTADDRVVIHHDANINPDFCTPDAGSGLVPGPIRALTFAQTQKFDCGSGARPAYAGARHVAVPGARIPTLDEVLRTFRGSDARFFAETKIPRGADIDPVKFATLIDAAVREHGLEDRLVLQSFDFRTIDALHAINPRIRTCLLGVPQQTRDYLAMLRQHHATCIVLDHDEIDAAGVRRLRAAGVLVFSGVADKPEDWRAYADRGVDAIFTNDPEGLIGFLRQAGLRAGTQD